MGHDLVAVGLILVQELDLLFEMSDVLLRVPAATFERIDALNKFAILSAKPDGGKNSGDFPQRMGGPEHRYPALEKWEEEVPL